MTFGELLEKKYATKYDNMKIEYYKSLNLSKDILEVEVITEILRQPKIDIVTKESVILMNERAKKNKKKYKFKYRNIPPDYNDTKISKIIEHLNGLYELQNDLKVIDYPNIELFNAINPILQGINIVRINYLWSLVNKV